MSNNKIAMFDSALVGPAIVSSFEKLNPAVQWRNPVMFVVYVGCWLTTALWLQALFGQGEAPAGFILAIGVWLWFTVLFANFAEALAEGRSKAQAASLRSLKRRTLAKKLMDRYERGVDPQSLRYMPTDSSSLKKGDVVMIAAGETIAADGEVLEGVASVDESAITGESAPVIRESGGDFSAVTGGTRVLSDWIIVRVTVNPGETFVDRMIAMVENAKRQKTPNEIALTILLVALTIVFLGVTVTLLPFSTFGVAVTGSGNPITITVLIALLVCLIPTTIAGLLSAIGVAGMSRMMQANVIATSGRAVEAAGDVDVLLMDKTGTITLGNRQATAFYEARGVRPAELAMAAQLASLSDETPEGRSIVTLCRQQPDGRAINPDSLGASFVPFSAHTRMSGVDLPDGTAIRKGAEDSIRQHVVALGGQFPAELKPAIDDIARRGITGDNPLTAAAIAAEAGVDDFLAEATPEAKLALIRQYQAEGRLVAMTGDGTNDAPALAQADVAVAMNTGTQAAKEAGNMVDLDSNPTKLIEIVETGKQMLMTRGSLTTFSIANDVAKYFAIIPAAFVTTYPQLSALNVMALASPASAILSAVVFNGLIIIFLIPLALKGVTFKPMGAAVLLRRNLAIYGIGGLIAPFIGIKLIDMLIAAIGMA